MPDSSRMTGENAPAQGRRRRKFGIALALLAIVLAAVVFGLPRLLDLNRYRDRIVSEIEKATGGKVALGRIAWGISTGLWVEADGLSIAGAPSFPVDLAVARVSARLALRPLLSKRIVVTRLLLDRPDVSLRLAPGPDDATPKAKPSPGAGSPAGPGPPVTIEKLVLQNGRFRLEDGVALPGRVLVHTATNIDLTVSPVIPGRTASFDISFEEAGPEGLGPFKAHGTLAGLKAFVAFENPLLTADVSIPGLQVGGLKPFLAGTEVIQRLSGQVGLAVHYTWDLGNRHAFDGTLDLGRAAYTDPSLWEGALPGTATTIAFRMSLDPDRLTFEQASVKRGPLSVTAHGILDNLGGQVVIRDALASLETPLPELISVAPWNAFRPSGPRLREQLQAADRVVSDRARSLVISAQIAGFPERPRVTASLRGPLRIDSAANEEGAALLRRAGWEDVRGTVDIDLAVALEIARPKDVRIRGRVALRDATGKPSGLPIRLENLEAEAAVTSESAEISRLSTTVELPAASPDSDSRVTVSLQGRIDGWPARSAVTLHHLETSPIPLPAASSLVPRENTGNAGMTVREILEAGGTLAVEELAFPRTELKQLSLDPAALLPKSRAVVSFAGIVFRPLPGFPAVEQVAGRASLENGVVTATGVRGRAGTLDLPDITIRIAGLESRPRSAFWAKGPLHVVAARNENVRELLRRHGLASLTGSLDIDLHAERNWATAEGWIGSGSLKLSGVRAVTFPAGVVVDGLEGRVTISRQAALDVTAEQITATVDGAPVRLFGSLRGAGSPEFAVDATAYAKGLDLARARELFPSLKPLGLAGQLEMDVNVSIPAAGTAPARLSGGVSARGVSLRLPGPGLAITNGDVDLALSGDAAEILRTNLQVNGQTLAVTGRIANPAEPDVRLAVTSPDLDLDRLFPPRRTAAPPPAPRAGRRESPPEVAELPDLLRKLTASLSVQAKQGRLRALGFHDLTLGAAFARGILTECDLGLGVGDGRIAAALTADLRNSREVPFVLRPRVTALEFETIAPVLGIPRAPAGGPVSLTGELQGRAGRSADLLSSLSGKVQAQMGPGTIKNVGRVGKLFARILSVASAARVLSGGFVTSFSREGLAYKTATAETTLAGGGLDVGTFTLESGALTLNAHGRIDLVQSTLDLKSKLAVLGVVDKVLGFVPVVGHAAQSMTSIPLGVKGSFDDPKVRLSVGQEFEKP